MKFNKSLKIFFNFNIRPSMLPTICFFLIRAFFCLKDIELLFVFFNSTAITQLEKSYKKKTTIIKIGQNYGQR